ncbi:hypothetical protein H6G64_20510 [Calothrix sp. FACHB-156]|nr:hypothetical protein [Nostoc linckia FACHB-104]MBD2339356.1 hypothetical protein [Calothrix sp. FACHB-156]
METGKSQISRREMHKYIWMLVGVFTLLAATYPTAMIRVSQKPQFHGYHVKSLPLNGHIANNSVK